MAEIETSALLPILSTQVLVRLNLPDKPKVRALIDSYSLAVMGWIKSIVSAADYAALLKDPTDTEVLDADDQDAFQRCYSYAMMREIAGLLNTQTSGEGIVQSTGFGETRTSLMSLAEIQNLQKSYDEKALRAIESFLNETGLKYLSAYTKVSSSRMRVTVITGEDTETETW